jgi:hypothetical protein
VIAAGYALQHHTAPGTMILLASSRTQDRLPALAISVHSKNGWDMLGNSSATSVPAAPDQVTLLEGLLHAGSYDGLRLGKIDLVGGFQIQSGITTPVLVSTTDGIVSSDGFYAGTDALNLALAELSGQLKAVPHFSLIDQNGRPFGNSQIAGHDVVLAAFHTTCHVTCPLYTGLFFQLWS